MLKPQLASIAGNLLMRTDSYKASHWLQYPPNTQTVFSYVEARGGAFGHSLFFGLQAYLAEYLTKAVTEDEVTQAAAFFRTSRMACCASCHGPMLGSTMILSFGSRYFSTKAVTPISLSF